MFQIDWCFIYGYEKLSQFHSFVRLTTFHIFWSRSYYQRVPHCLTCESVHSSVHQFSIILIITIIIIIIIIIVIIIIIIIIIHRENYGLCE